MVVSVLLLIAPKLMAYRSAVNVSHDRTVFLLGVLAFVVISAAIIATGKLVVGGTMRYLALRAHGKNE